MKNLLFILALNCSLLFCNYSFCQWQRTTEPKDTINCLIEIGDTILAGTSNGLFFSTNNGSGWNAINNGLTNTDVWTLAKIGINIFVGTQGGGIFLSTNNGTNWIAVNDGLTHFNVNTFVISGNYIFAGTNGGVYLTSNNGTSWTTVNNGLTNYFVWSSAIIDTNIFIGTDGGVFLTTNNGTDWTAVNNGLTNNDIQSLIISGTNIFAGTDVGVFLTTNNGTNWRLINTVYNNTIESFDISGNYIFAGSWGGGVYFSKNNGTIWSAINNGLTNSFVGAIIIRENDIFAGTDGSGVWKRSISDILGINELQTTNNELQTKIYPNPADNYIFIKNSPNPSPGLSRVTLRTLQGQEVLSENLKFTDTYKLDLPNLTNGIYFLTIQNDKENYVTKLVIQK